MTVITRQVMSIKLDKLLMLLDLGRQLCEEQARNDDAWRMADLAIRLREGGANIQEPALEEAAGKWLQLAARMDFAIERVGAAVAELGGGLDSAKNAAKIIGYMDDIVRALARFAP